MSGTLFLPAMRPQHQAHSCIMLRTFVNRETLLNHLLAVTIIAAGILTVLLVLTVLLGTDVHRQILGTLGLPHGWDMGLPILIALVLVAVTAGAKLIHSTQSHYQALISDLLQSEARRILGNYPVDTHTQWSIESTLRGDEHAHDAFSQLCRLHDIEYQYIPTIISL